MTSNVSAPASHTTHLPTVSWVIAGALTVAAVLGFGGNFAPVGPVQDTLHGLSAVALVLGAILLALEHAGVGHQLGAAGFAILAFGETRILNPHDVPGGEASFAAGVLLYVPALLLVATSPWAPRWARVTGALAAVPFAAHGLALFGGVGVESDGPLASVGYALLTLTMIGWIITVLRGPVTRGDVR